MSEKSYVENARFLVALGSPDGKMEAYYDDDEGLIHDLGHDELSISTDYADDTTYVLKRVGDGPDCTFAVHVERLDNYKLNHKAQKIICPIDADEEQELAESLVHIVDHIKMVQEKQSATNAEVAALGAMMIAAGEWEWTAWSQIGTADIQRALDESKIPISLVAPTEKEERKVFASADFSKSLLQWFRHQLNPHGWTLVAVSPYDEFQAFALVRNDDLTTVRALLKKQGRKIQ